MAGDNEMKWFLLALLVFLLAPGVVSATTSTDVTVNATPDHLSFTVTPAGFAFGVLARNTTVWANGYPPSWPLVSTNCTFTINSTSTYAMDIDVKGSDMSSVGVYKWVLSSTQNTDQYVMKIGVEGMVNEAAMITLNKVAWQEFVSNLGSGLGIRWEILLLSPTLYSESTPVSARLYLSARVTS